MSCETFLSAALLFSILGFGVAEVTCSVAPTPLASIAVLSCKFRENVLDNRINISLHHEQNGTEVVLLTCRWKKEDTERPSCGGRFREYRLGNVTTVVTVHFEAIPKNEGNFSCYDDSNDGSVSAACDFKLLIPTTEGTASAATTSKTTHRRGRNEEPVGIPTGLVAGTTIAGLIFVGSSVVLCVVYYKSTGATLTSSASLGKATRSSQMQKNRKRSGPARRKSLNAPKEFLEVAPVHVASLPGCKKSIKDPEEFLQAESVDAAPYPLIGPPPRTHPQERFVTPPLLVITAPEESLGGPNDSQGSAL